MARTRSKLRLAAMSVAGLLVLTAVAGCSNANKDGSSSSKIFVLPVINSETGNGAPYGEYLKQAYSVALDEINRSGGIHGRKLEYKYYDDRSSPTVAAGLMRSLAKTALVVAGPVLTNEAAGTFPVAKSFKLPTFATTPSVAVIESGQPWSFSSVPPANVAMPPLVQKWLHLYSNTSNVSLIYDTQNAATLSQGAEMETSLKQAGVKIPKIIKTQTGSPSYQSQAQQIAAAKPDGVGVCGLTPDATAMVLAIRKAGFEGPVLVCAADANPSLLGSDTTDVSLMGTWAESIPGDMNRVFVAAYKKLPGSPTPPPTAGPWYYTPKAIAKAINATNVLDSKESLEARREVLRKYISTMEMDGFTGPVRMAPQGYFNYDNVLIRYDRGAQSVAP